MADDFYPFVDSGDPAPDNHHITGAPEGAGQQSMPVSSINPADAALFGLPEQADARTVYAATDMPPEQGYVEKQGEGAGLQQAHPSNAVPQTEVESTVFATRIAIYDDMLSTPRVLVVQPKDPRTYLEEVTNTVYRCMKEQGGTISLMVIRELVENFIHAHFAEPIVSVLDGGNTIRFADQGPGINDKERAFEFGVTSADRSMKRYIRGTGAGLPMVQQYLENAGGAVSIEDNMGAGTVVTVSVDPARVVEIENNSRRGAAVRGTQFTSDQIGRRAGVGANPMGSNPNAVSSTGWTPTGGYEPYTPQMGSPSGGTVGWGAPQYAEQPAQAAPGTPQPYVPQQNAFPTTYNQEAGGVEGFGPEMNPSAGTPASEQATRAGGAASYPQPGPQQAPQAYGQAYTAQPFVNSPYGASPAWQQQTGWPQQPTATPYGYPAQPYGAVPGMPAMQSFQQYGQKFSTIQQFPYQMGGTPYPDMQQPAAHQSVGDQVFLSERALLALGFLAQNGQGGPTELTNTYGHSGPTWSRELATLSKYGFVTKHGRKYFITELGAAWVQEHGTQG